MISPREQGFNQEIQPPFPQGSGPLGYIQPPFPQGIGPQGYIPPPFLQGVGPQGYVPPPFQQSIGPQGYVQQPQPGFSQPVQQAQQEMPQFAFGQMLQPQQDFSGQGAQFAPGYDLYQQSGGAQPDVPRTRRGPKNYARSDERIRELICERLIQELSIDVSDVSVEVQSGQVSLAGTVPDRQMKHAIEDVVDRCWGVQDIENNIRVQSAQEPGNTERGFAAQQGRTVTQAGGGFAGSSAVSGSAKAGGRESTGRGKTAAEL